MPFDIHKRRRRTDQDDAAEKPLNVRVITFPARRRPRLAGQTPPSRTASAQFAALGLALLAAAMYFGALLRHPAAMPHAAYAPLACTAFLCALSGASFLVRGVYGLMVRR
jgi:hypothetical protein